MQNYPKQLIDTFFVMYNANTTDDGVLLILIFILGNLGIAVLAFIVALFLNNSKKAYYICLDICTSSILAIMLNIILYISQIFDIKFRTVLYIDLFIRLLTYTLKYIKRKKKQERAIRL